MIAEMQGSENTRGLAAPNKERRKREPQLEGRRSWRSVSEHQWVSCSCSNRLEATVPLTVRTTEHTKEFLGIQVFWGLPSDPLGHLFQPSLSSHPHNDLGEGCYEPNLLAAVHDII